MTTSKKQQQTQASNYETAKQQAQALFLKYDQAKIIRKFQLIHDEQYLYLSFISRVYRISRSSGAVQWSEDGFVTCMEAGHEEVMTIFDVLCYSKPDCHLAGEYVHMQSLSAIKGGGVSLGASLFRKTEEQFDHKDFALVQACEKLNGTKIGRGDVAYQIPVFDFLPARFQFWNSDEDFGASIVLFFDKNILDYMHYETVWFMAFHLLSRIAEEMEQ